MSKGPITYDPLTRLFHFRSHQVSAARIIIALANVHAVKAGLPRFQPSFARQTHANIYAEPTL